MDLHLGKAEMSVVRGSLGLGKGLKLWLMGYFVEGEIFHFVFIVVDLCC